MSSSQVDFDPNSKATAAPPPEKPGDTAIIETALGDKNSRRFRSIKSRIYLTCGLLVCVCFAIGSVGWLGQQQLLSTFARYEKTAELTRQIVNTDRDVTSLKASAENFLLTGASSQERLAKRGVDQIINEVTEIASTTSDGELQDLLDEMLVHLRSFKSQFAVAGDERNLRTRLVQDELPREAARVEELIREIRATVENASRSNPAEDLPSQLRDIDRAFNAAQANLLQYLADPRYLDIRDMAEHLEDARVLAVAARDDESPSSTRLMLEQLVTAIDAYRRTAIRTFQATRGYLFYSNVVLAGEISEFVHYSDRAKSWANDRQAIVREARSSAAERTRALTIAAFIAAIVAAFLLAASLSYQLVAPLSLITQTFRRLASGETVQEIPGTSRLDEIGRMSRAAAVFNTKNQETRELLAEASRLSQELEAKASALAESNQELDNFAYVASHDLKSPLRGIQLLSEWVVEDSHDQLSEESKEHLQLLGERVEKMNDLLDDLLQYSRVGRVEQEIERVACGELVESIIRVTNNEKNAAIIVREPMPTLTTAKTPLQQTLLNLITNAVKYNDKAENGKIEVSCEDLGEFFAFTVEDNGIGIDSKHHDRIFQMYQRCAPTHADGSGMGLAIIKKQVESYGGTISVQSTLGVGSAFTFTWPKSIDREHMLPAQENSTLESPAVSLA